jgi:hypothetical protein
MPNPISHHIGRVVGGFPTSHSSLSEGSAISTFAPANEIVVARRSDGGSPHFFRRRSGGLLLSGHPNVPAGGCSGTRGCGTGSR